MYRPTPSAGYPILVHEGVGGLVGEGTSGDLGDLVQVRYNNDDRSAMMGVGSEELEKWYVSKLCCGSYGGTGLNVNASLGMRRFFCGIRHLRAQIRNTGSSLALGPPSVRISLYIYLQKFHPLIDIPRTNSCRQPPRPARPLRIRR